MFISELFYTFEGFIIYLYVVILSCILISKQDHVLCLLSNYFLIGVLTSDYLSFCVFVKHSVSVIKTSQLMCIGKYIILYYIILYYIILYYIILYYYNLTGPMYMRSVVDPTSLCGPYLYTAPNFILIRLMQKISFTPLSKIWSSPYRVSNNSQ